MLQPSSGPSARPRAVPDGTCPQSPRPRPGAARSLGRRPSGLAEDPAMSPRHRSRRRRGGSGYPRPPPTRRRPWDPRWPGTMAHCAPGACSMLGGAVLESSAHVGTRLARDGSQVLGDESVAQPPGNSTPVPRRPLVTRGGRPLPPGPSLRAARSRTRPSLGGRAPPSEPASRPPTWDSPLRMLTDRPSGIPHPLPALPILAFPDLHFGIRGRGPSGCACSLGCSRGSRAPNAEGGGALGDLEGPCLDKPVSIFSRCPPGGVAAEDAVWANAALLGVPAAVPEAPAATLGCGAALSSCGTLRRTHVTMTPPSLESLRKASLPNEAPSPRARPLGRPPR